MMKHVSPPTLETRRHPPFAEFVALLAFMMGLTALSIDNLLPAFGAIQASYGIEDPNRLQMLVYMYMMGFGLAQLAYGPISDMVGRRPVLMAGLVIYAAGCLMAAFAPSFGVLIAARIVQGVGVAAARVLAMAIVRDCFAGREMARVMSLTFAVFIIVPVFAPAVGSFTLLFGDWHVVFLSMLGLCIALGVWIALRLPETLHPEYRLPFSARRVLQGIRLTAGTRVAIGYGTAVGLMMGSIMSYVGSAQQIFQTEVYGLGAAFPIAFGSIAAVMGIASLLNSRLVGRFGMHRLSHTGTVGFLLISLTQLAVAVAYDGRPPLLLFGAILATTQFLLSLSMPNFNAMAMAPLGAVAGTASSFLGFYTTLLGSFLGLVVGQSFDGTVLPLGLGYVGLSSACLLVVLWTERGRLFRSQHSGTAGS